MNKRQISPSATMVLYVETISKGNYYLRIFDRAKSFRTTYFHAQSFKRGEWTLYNRLGTQVMRDATMQALINALLHSPVSYHQELSDKETV